MATDYTRVILVVGMLITGSINTLSKKAQNDTSSVGLDGDKDFKKAWFQTAVMFAGELMCLLGLWFQRIRKREAMRKDPLLGSYKHTIQMRNEETDQHVLLNDGSGAQKDLANPLLAQVVNDTQNAMATPKSKAPEPVSPYFFIIPATFDLAGTTLSGIGLYYTTASVFQMLRGSIVVFSGLLSLVFLKRKFERYHWCGMGVVTVGLIMVGLSGLLAPSDDSSNNVPLGVILILGAQMMGAVQFIIEESFLKSKNLPPLQVVGMEGFWGLLAMVILVLPLTTCAIKGSDNGHYEDAVDALYMIGNSPKLLALVLLYFCSIAFYNYFGLTMAKVLSSVHRTMIDALRTAVVWTVSLFVYYVISKSFGEPWTNYSYLQLAGFIFLLVGTVIYNHLLKIPGMEPPPVPSTPAPATIDASHDVPDGIMSDVEEDDLGPEPDDPQPVSNSLDDRHFLSSRDDD